jgi:hypothetical protein
MGRAHLYQIHDRAHRTDIQAQGIGGVKADNVKLYQQIFLLPLLGKRE